jgi:uncharacterized damage-inducible protein DinB
MSDSTAFREHLVRVLEWDDAHVSFDTAVSGVPTGSRGIRAAGFEHSLWQLVEHIRIAQDDILDFAINRVYEQSMAWPADYWPKDPAPPSDDAWSASLTASMSSREALKRLARDVPDLTARVPTGKGPQTYLRAILLAADHAAYHVGQIVALRKALGIWPAHG